MTPFKVLPGVLSRQILLVFGKNVNNAWLHTSVFARQTMSEKLKPYSLERALCRQFCQGSNETRQEEQKKTDEQIKLLESANKLAMIYIFINTGMRVNIKVYKQKCFCLCVGIKGFFVVEL